MMLRIHCCFNSVKNFFNIFLFFFQWGDAHHPLCGHGKITVIREVLKQNANNGREFYCCPFPKTKQCDFFQWVNDVTAK